MVIKIKEINCKSILSTSGIPGIDYALNPTKSSLILRDLDLLKKIKMVDVGITNTTLDEEVRKVLEPYEICF